MLSDPILHVVRRGLAVSTRKVAAGAIALLATASAVFAGEPLPQDPNVVVGRLENRLQYVLSPRPGEGEASIRLIVRVSPLDEADDEIGASRLLGLLPFGEDARATLLKRIGTGGEANSDVAFDGTTFRFDVPNANDFAIDSILRFTAETLAGPSLSDDNLQAQWKALYSMRAASRTPRTSAQAALFSLLGAEIDLGRRFFGDEQRDRERVGVETLQEFHRKWYAPSNASIVMVGDFDAADMVSRIERIVGAIEGREGPPVRTALSNSPSEQPFVIEQEGLYVADMDIVRLTAPRPPARTLDDLRDEVVNDIVEKSLERRIETAAHNRGATLDTAQVWSFDMGGRFTLHNAYVRSEPQDWPMLTLTLADALQSLADNPLTSEEVDHARDLLSASENRRRIEQTTMSVSEEASRITRFVSRGDTIMTPADESNQRVLALRSVDAGFAAQRATEVYAIDDGALTLTIPPIENTPTSEDVFRVIQERSGARLSAPVTDIESVLSLLPAPSGDTRIDQMEMHPAAGVLSAWLSNGVRVHHRRMNGDEGLVRVSVTLAGGRIAETAETHGLTDAATTLFWNPALEDVDLESFRGVLSRSTIEIGARVREDVVLINASSHRDDAEKMVRLLSALLQRGRIDRESLERWRTEQVYRIREERSSPFRSGPRVMANTVFQADEFRLQPPTEEEIRAITVEAAESWLSTLLDECPVEVAIVGDVERDDALDLATKWFGNLTTRPRVSPIRGPSMAEARFAATPHRKVYEFEGKADQGVAIVGFHTSGRIDERTALPFELAASALNERLKKVALGSEKHLEAPYALSWASSAYRNHGFIAAIGISSSAEIDDVAAQLDRSVQWLIATGPDSVLLREIRNRIAQERERGLASSEVWAEYLAQMSLRGRTPKGLQSEPSRIRELTVQDVQRAVRGSASPESMFRIIARSGAESQEQAGAR